MPKIWGKSKLWAHFSRSDDSKTAKCRHCSKFVKTSGNTSNLRAHLERYHDKKMDMEEWPALSQPQPLQLNSLQKSTPSSSPGPEPSTSKEIVSQDQVKKTNTDQETILHCFKKVSDYKDGGIVSNKIVKAIIYMICKDCQPFAMVERTGFRKLLKTMAPQFQIPDRTTIKRFIENKYTCVAQQLKEKIKDKTVTLTTDVWTDLQMRSYLGVTAHFLHESKTKMVTVSLSARVMDERHSAEYLKEILLAVCKEWNIKEENILAIVTDNASNITKAVELSVGSKKHVPCFAHTLNLVAERALEECNSLQDIIQKLKDIVTWFKRSVVASDDLRKKTDKKLIQSVPTRWNSVFEMIKRFLELRPIINEIINNHRNAPPMIPVVETEILAEASEILQPLHAATINISGEKFATSSLVIPIITIIQEKLSGLQPKYNETKILLTKIKEQISRRFGSSELVSNLALATLLDPRFKKMYFQQPLAVAKHVNVLNTLMKIESAGNVSNGDGEWDQGNSSSDSDQGTSIFSGHNKKVR